MTGNAEDAASVYKREHYTVSRTATNGNESSLHGKNYRMNWILSTHTTVLIPPDSV